MIADSTWLECPGSFDRLSLPLNQWKSASVRDHDVNDLRIVLQIRPAEYFDFFIGSLEISTV